MFNLNLLPGSTIVIADKETLKAAIREVFEEMGLSPDVERHKVQSSLPEQIPGYIVKKQLTEKGYKVKSHYAFKALLEEYGIAGRLKGRTHWYSTQEISRIPQK